MKTNTNYMRRTILRLCANNPELINDDVALIAKVWQEEGWYNEMTLLQNLRRVSKPETIRRTRQKLQQEGLIKANERTTESRYEDFKYNYYNL